MIRAPMITDLPTVSFINAGASSMDARPWAVRLQSRAIRAEKRLIVSSSHRRYYSQLEREGS